MKANRYWIAVIILLIAVIVTGGIIIQAKHQPNRGIEISIAPEPEIAGEVYLGGAVKNPGFYPFREGDSITGLVRDAGGLSDNADLSQVKVSIADNGEPPPQKVDINRAEAWLLQALPGIGEGRARAIITYRQENGRFASTAELLRVPGIGDAVYDGIKHLVTVADE